MNDMPGGYDAGASINDDSGMGAGFPTGSNQ